MSRCRRVGGNIDAQIADHSLGYRTIRSRALDRKRASEAQHEILVHLELIALRVPAEIVVVFQDEDARCLAGSLMEEARGRETADARRPRQSGHSFRPCFQAALQCSRRCRRAAGARLQTRPHDCRAIREQLAGHSQDGLAPPLLSCANECGVAAAAMAMAAPFMKSRRVIRRSMPSSLSVQLID